MLLHALIKSCFSILSFFGSSVKLGWVVSFYIKWFSFNFCLVDSTLLWNNLWTIPKNSRNFIWEARSSRALPFKSQLDCRRFSYSRRLLCLCNFFRNLCKLTHIHCQKINNHFFFRTVQLTSIDSVQHWSGLRDVKEFLLATPLSSKTQKMLSALF